MTLNSSLAGIRQYKFQEYWNNLLGIEYIPVSLEFCDADSRNTGIIQGISS